MPTVLRPCGAKIHYAVHGAAAALPALLIAPGGMRSTLMNWASQPYDPLTRLSGEYRVIAMDQRNCGQSEGPLATDWDTYRDDQLAVLDDAGVESGCLLIGSCIGPSYIVNLLKAAPQRFRAAVLMQPIGLAEHTTEPVPWQGINREASQHWFGDWANERTIRGLNSREELARLYESMFTLPEQDGKFIFTATRQEVCALQHPLLILAGKDMFHPTAVARELAASAPNARFMERWRDQDMTPDVVARIEGFLREHSQ